MAHDDHASRHGTNRYNSEEAKHDVFAAIQRIKDDELYGVRRPLVGGEQVTQAKPQQAMAENNSIPPAMLKAAGKAIAEAIRMTTRSALVAANGMFSRLPPYMSLNYELERAAHAVYMGDRTPAAVDYLIASALAVRAFEEGNSVDRTPVPHHRAA